MFSHLTLKNSISQGINQKLKKIFDIFCVDNEK